MNGAHDMGGMEGFGPVNPEPENEEPVFHDTWEGRVFGINRSLGVFRLWNIDIGRHSRERQHPVDYLKHSYYENWLAGIETLLVESGLVTKEELRTGRQNSPVPEGIRGRLLTAEMAGMLPIRVSDYGRHLDAPALFKPGDRVRTINSHPSGHTREPRYIRGHVGTIHEYYGAQIFPDLSVQGIDEGRHLYSVRFEATELWGERAASQGAVYVDLWEPYLESQR